MPQGRRKHPFSQKQKKAQLQLKREKRREFIKSASFLDNVTVAPSNDTNNNAHSCGSGLEDDRLNEKPNGKSSVSVSAIGASLEVEESVSESEYSGSGGDSDSGSDSATLKDKQNQAMPVQVRKLNQPSRDDSWRPRKRSSCFNQASALLRTAGGRGEEATRYRLHFAKESRAEIDGRKLRAQRHTLTAVPKEQLQMDIDQVFGREEEGEGDGGGMRAVMEMPKRPRWNYKLDRLRLEQQEESYFRHYIQEIYATAEQNNLSPEQVSYFELNLETWRQLWRVLEMSDILLLICDVRHPVLHLAPSLYSHIVQDLKKPLVLILNKADLVPAAVAVAWKHYLQIRFPRVHIVLYSTNPDNYATRYSSSANAAAASETKVKTGRKKPTAKNYIPPVGLQELVAACEKSVPQFDFSAWNFKVSKQMCRDYEYLSETNNTCAAGDRDSAAAYDHSSASSILTVGCVGHPNVGKSSVINSIVGRKVVSTSRTPGHTKHFQTHYVTCNVQLCDCPGLVFPSIVDKQQQILSGLFPIAQVQEPYTTVGYIAERLPLVQMLRLRHPEEADGETEWTAWDVCEAWAIKRGFRVARTGGKYDVYRAANHLLRLAVEGNICLLTYPPHFFAEEQSWGEKPETKLLRDRMLNATHSPELHHPQQHQQQSLNPQANRQHSSSRAASSQGGDDDEEEEEEEEDGEESERMGKSRRSSSGGGSNCGSAVVTNKFSQLLDLSD